MDAKVMAVSNNLEGVELENSIKVVKYKKEELYRMDAVDVYKLVLEQKIKKFPNGFWQQPEALQNAIKCTKFLLEELLKFSDEDIKSKLSTYSFVNNKLRGMLMMCFNTSPYEALNAAYPDKFKPWELSQTPLSYWGDDVSRGIAATRWLIEDKLGLSDDEVREQLSVKLFKDNGLKGMLERCYNGSPYEALNAAYPDKFKPWELNHAPVKYWNDINNCIEAVRWVIEEKLGLSDDEIKERISVKFFIDNGLKGMLGNRFNNSPYEALNAAYPGRFKPWDFGQVPTSYWSDVNNCIEAIHWVIDEKLGLSEEDIKEQVSVQFFTDNRLLGMLSQQFNTSPYEALNAAYPGRFKPWDFGQVPTSYWNDLNNCIEAIRWVVEEKLGLSEEEIKEQVSVQFFVDNGLRGMLIRRFNASPYEALNTAYPGRFKPWELRQTPVSYWDNIENAIEAIHWVIEEKLGLSEEEIKEQISGQFFTDNGLRGMLISRFNASPYEALNVAYPGRFKPWELKSAPSSYWDNIENAIEAIHWLIDEKLELSEDDIEEQISTQTFIDNGLRGMLIKCFNGSIYRALSAAYPNKLNLSGKRGRARVKKSIS